MSNIWKRWCRLCGNENGSEIDIFIKDENFLSISDAIQRFLSVDINTFDEAPTRICKICHEQLNGLITFWTQSTKVQEMFSELQFNDKFEMLADLEELRLKYGLKSNINSENVHFKELDQSENLNIDNYTKQNQDQHNSNFTKNEEEYNYDEINTNESNHQQSIFYDDNEIEELNIKNSNTKDSLSLSVANNSIDLVNIKNAKRICKTMRKTKIKQFSNKSGGSSCKRKNRDRKNINKTEDSKNPIAFCEICQQSFFNKGGYTFHLKSKHSIVNEPIPCKYCNKTFKAISDHQKHESTHLPPDERRSYPCPHCGKKFFSEGNLNSHVRVVHIREKSFICEECGKSFVTVDGLNSHKLVHTDEKPFQCTKCSKSFKRLPTLKLHIDSHEQSKYICSICGQQLNSKALLRRHMVVHSDKKKYKCNFCEKEFKRPDAFKHHLILHTGLKPYECPFCQQTFANGSNCRKHQKTTHPNELAAAEEAGQRRVCRNVPKIEQLRAVNEGAAVDSVITEKNKFKNEGDAIDGIISEDNNYKVESAIIDSVITEGKNEQFKLF